MQISSQIVANSLLNTRGPRNPKFLGTFTCAYGRFLGVDYISKLRRQGPKTQNFGGTFYKGHTITKLFVVTNLGQGKCCEIHHIFIPRVMTHHSIFLGSRYVYLCHFT